MTGYPSIDKPWIKYYTEQQKSVRFEPMSMYQLVRKNNAAHQNDTAFNYMGNQISYGTLLRKIDDAANAMAACGVQSGDTVAMLMVNTPEAAYVFYAANKIGAIVNSIDPRTKPEQIKKDLDLSKPKIIFAVDILQNMLDGILKDIDNPCVVLVSPFLSLPPVLKLAAGVKSLLNPKKESAYQNWPQFLKKQRTSAKEVFQPDSPALIVHTGGSTGTPKGVMLSNENANALAYQLLNCNMGFHRNARFLNILPPFIALGLVNAMHLAACSGLESILIPSIKPEEYPDLVLKYKPNMLMAGPIHYQKLIESEKMGKVDLSFLEICVSGGDTCPLEFQEKVQRFLKERNAKANLCIGYGATETSAGSSCMRNDCFKMESVGVPYLHNVMTVVNPETGKEICGYNQTGELMVSGPTLMMGYWGTTEEETQKVIVTDDNGVQWYRTGDLAHIDEDGYIYIDGRIKRIIVSGGMKIYPAHVESLIRKHPYVKECAVVGVADPDKINIPVVNLVLYPEFNLPECKTEVIRFIEQQIKDLLPDYTKIAGYNFLDNMPLTPIGKLDFRALEKMGVL